MPACSVRTHLHPLGLGGSCLFDVAGFFDLTEEVRHVVNAGHSVQPVVFQLHEAAVHSTGCDAVMAALNRAGVGARCVNSVLRLFAVPTNEGCSPSMTAFDSLLQHQPVAFLDGGLGTELEQRGVAINNTRLWSASLLQHNPAVLQDIHYDYFKAGKTFTWGPLQHKPARAYDNQSLHCCRHARCTLGAAFMQVLTLAQHLVIRPLCQGLKPRAPARQTLLSCL